MFWLRGFMGWMGMILVSAMVISGCVRGRGSACSGSDPAARNRQYALRKGHFPIDKMDRINMINV
jgi:hypothetical protein